MDGFIALVQLAPLNAAISISWMSTIALFAVSPIMPLPLVLLQVLPCLASQDTILMEITALHAAVFSPIG